MKKHLLSFALLSVLVLAGCSETSATSSDEGSSAEEASSVVESTAVETSSEAVEEGESSILEEEEEEEEEVVTHDYVVDLANLTSPAVWGEEASSSEWTLGDFYYWNDQGWCGANITMGNNSYSEEAGGYNFAWTTEDYDVGWATAAQWYAMQIFMKLPANSLGDVGGNFTITATITVAAETKITLCGNEITLAAGENTITDLVSNTTVYDTTANNAELSIQAGWASDNSHTYTGDITINYLAFDSYTIPDTDPADDDSHDYVVDLANAADAVFGEETSAASWTAGNFYYWNDQWWCGTNITVNAAAYDETAAAYNFSWTSDTAGTPLWWAYQVFMKLPSGYIAEGSQFTVTATITAEAETKITLCGNEITLAAGENTITDLLASEVVHSSTENDAEISIQAGWDSASAYNDGNISISYLAFDAYTAAE